MRQSSVTVPGTPMSSDSDSLETTPASPPTSDPSKIKGKMNPTKWAEARKMAEVDGIRASKIAEHFDISPSLVSRYFNDNDITVGSKVQAVQDKAMDAAAEKMAKQITDFQVARKQRIMETKIDHYNWSTYLAKAGMQLIGEAKKTGTALAMLNPDLKALRQAMILVKQARDERFIVLDAMNEIDEATLPGIEIHDLTDEQIETLQKADAGMDVDDADSEVVELS